MHASKKYLATLPTNPNGFEVKNAFVAFSFSTLVKREPLRFATSKTPPFAQYRTLVPKVIDPK